MQGVECAWISVWLATTTPNTAAPSTPPASPPTPPCSESDPRLPATLSLFPDAADTDLGSVEMPWWVYSSAGMHLIFPSSLPSLAASQLLTGPRAVAASADHEQELQFDREVFPIGVSLMDAAVIGITQRLHRAPVGPPQAAPSSLQVPSPDAVWMAASWSLEGEQLHTGHRQDSCSHAFCM
jgi:hypothetical protein